MKESTPGSNCLVFRPRYIPTAISPRPTELSHRAIYVLYGATRCDQLQPDSASYLHNGCCMYFKSPELWGLYHAPTRESNFRLHGLRFIAVYYTPQSKLIVPSRDFPKNKTQRYCIFCSDTLISLKSYRNF